jgi:putative flippase GtrA
MLSRDISCQLDDREPVGSPHPVRPLPWCPVTAELRGGPGPIHWLLGLYYRLGHLVRELMKFGVVGAVAYVVDLGLFNVFLVLVGLGPLTSKVLSSTVAVTVAYVGNRHWTFRHRARSGFRREYTLFFILNAIGLGISLTVLAISHYVLGFTSPLADNIAANGVGLLLATTFRFIGYRTWVFRAVTDPAVPPGPMEWVAPVDHDEPHERRDLLGPDARDLTARDDSSAAGSQPGQSDDLAPRDPEPAAG